MHKLWHVLLGPIRHISVQEHEEGECFNPGWLEDDDEKVIVEEIGSCITALCSQPGRVILTQSRIYFQPFNVESISPIQTYQLNKVSLILTYWRQRGDSHEWDMDQSCNCCATTLQEL